MKYFVFISALGACVSDLQAQIYKWVDSDGVTHYGRQPPAVERVEQVYIKTEKENFYPRSHKQQPKESKKPRKDTSDATLAVGQNATQLDCNAALDNSRIRLDTASENSKKDYLAGKIDKAQYRKKTEDIRKLNRVSIPECQTAAGDVKNFYLCISNEWNSIEFCAQKYRYLSEQNQDDY